MDNWIANLSDGSTHVEKWLAGYVSPWNRLMQYCQTNHCWVTGLRLTMGNQTLECPKQAMGYWQAHAMPATQGWQADEELDKWRGIGWVDPSGVVQVYWMARDPSTHQVVAWQEQKNTQDQAQIIWSGIKH